jgi:hypothetical protein
MPSVHNVPPDLGHINEIPKWSVLNLGQLLPAVQNLPPIYFTHRQK